MRARANLLTNYNVTSMTDSSGDVVERYRYDPYGNVTVLNPDGSVEGDGTAASSVYGWIYLYQDMRLDVTTGIYDDDKRQTYDPSLGRFLQQDPAGDVNGPNTYQLEEGNSVDRVDPSGEDVAGGYPLPGMFPGMFNPPWTPPPYPYAPTPPTPPAPAPDPAPVSQWITDNIAPWFLSNPGLAGSMFPVLGPFRNATCDFNSGHPFYGSLWVLATALDALTLGELSYGRPTVMGLKFPSTQFGPIHPIWEVGGQLMHGFPVNGVLQTTGRGVLRWAGSPSLRLPLILDAEEALREGIKASNCVTAAFGAWWRSGGPAATWGVGRVISVGGTALGSSGSNGNRSHWGYPLGSNGMYPGY
jgi:RHS repeat-associated protein